MTRRFASEVTAPSARRATGATAPRPLARRIAALSAFAAAAALVPCIPAAAQQPAAGATYTYRIVPLAGLESRPNGIDRYGRVVGTVWTGAVEPTNASVRIRQAALWDSLGNFTNLHPLISPGDVNGYASNARAINSLGQVAGSVGQVGYTHQPYVWKPSPGGGETGTLFLLGRFAGSNGLNIAYGINDGGLVVGGALMPDGDIAFRWSEDGAAAPAPLQPLSPGADSSASAVNASGLIAGRSAYVSGSTISARAVVWGAGGEILDLGTLGGDYSSASDLNDAGVVVGTAGISGKPGSGNLNRAFRCQVPGGAMLYLGTLGEHSAALGVNNLGEVVGWSRPLSSGKGNTATFLAAVRYHDAIGVEDLASTLEGGLGPFIRMEQATDASDVDPSVSPGATAGQIIGYGFLANGETQGFRMVPVEPTLADLPSALAAASVTSSAATLTWSYAWPAGAPAGTFRADYKGPNGRWVRVPGTPSPSGAGYTLAVTGLTAATKYHFRVRAESTDGAGGSDVSHFAVAAATTAASTRK